MAESIQKSGSQKVENDGEDNILPSSKLAISSNHRTAPFSILSWKSLRKIVGDVVYDDETALSNLQSTIKKLNCRLWDIYKVYQPDEARSKSPLATRVKAKFVAAVAFTARHYLMMVLDREDQEFKMSAKVSHFVKHCITLLEQSAMASNSIKDDRLLTHA